MTPKQAIEYLQSKGAEIKYQHLIYLARKGYVKATYENGKYGYLKAGLDRYLADTDNGKIQPHAVYHHLHNTITVQEAVEYIKSIGLNATQDKIYKSVKKNRLKNSGENGKYAFEYANLDKYIVWLKKYQELFKGDSE